MNHGQSFIPGRTGRVNSRPGTAPAPNPAAVPPPTGGMDMATGAPIMKQRGGKMARPRTPRTPLQQAILPQG